MAANILDNSSDILLSAFNTSSTIDLFAMVTHGIDRQRLRVFDVHSGLVSHDYYPTDKDEFTCLKWVKFREADIESQDAKEQKKSKFKEMILLGTQSGDILVFSLADNTVIKRIAAMENVAISNIVYYKADKRAIALGANGRIVDVSLTTEELDVRSWSCKKVCCIAPCSDNMHLAVATGGDITIYDIMNQKSLKEISSAHTKSIALMSYSNSTDLLFSVAKNDPVIRVWPGVRNRNTTHADRLVMTRPVVFLDVPRKREDTILAITEDGVASIFRLVASSKEKEMKRPTMTIEILSDSKRNEHIPILSSRFIPDKEGSSVVIARGSGVRVLFEPVRYMQQQGIITGDVVLTRSVVKRTSQTASDEAALTMEDIKALNDQYVPPSREFLPRMLVEATSSMDTEAINACIRQDDPAAIQAAVRGLPKIKINQFMRWLLPRYEQNVDGQGAALQKWIKTMVREHHSYMLGNEDMVSELTHLYELLSKRLETYPQLYAMQGRLDLIQNQINVRTRTANLGDEAVIFTDEEEEESDDELENDVPSDIEDERRENKDMMDLIGDADDFEDKEMFAEEHLTDEEEEDDDENEDEDSDLEE
ncbi:uncharacterized protein BYT42DRAFT_609226 [Radiomyces spectabilis]|uniref:uncharacterized protein n=1 Tax=Radiomyces spectabilis TaxID=64574 RepID=UPI00222020D8|nr:uncharacterized protein BYT42DRAFT_609226 [Radiomyces spectabilis]KAI8393432.1 hypothetical protein BYT42DRAFT_609226 [Radiomyces spectabilis]